MPKDTRIFVAYAFPGEDSTPNIYWYYVHVGSINGTSGYIREDLLSL